MGEGAGPAQASRPRRGACSWLPSPPGLLQNSHSGWSGSQDAHCPLVSPEGLLPPLPREPLVCVLPTCGLHRLLPRLWCQGLGSRATLRPRKTPATQAFPQQSPTRVSRAAGRLLLPLHAPAPAQRQELHGNNWEEPGQLQKYLLLVPGTLGRDQTDPGTGV